MIKVINADALEALKGMETGSVHCCVTSPPYWGLRDYSVEGQLGLEKTPEEYVAKMVEVFREVRRVLRKDGTLWLNLGDSYAHNGPCGGSSPDGDRAYRATDRAKQEQMDYRVPHGLKPKDLCGIPWRVAFALQADGWWLRSDIIWAKPNPMPESVTDRPTKSHEYLFLLTKSANYFYDAEAIREEGSRYAWNAPQFKCGDITRHHGNPNGGGGSPCDTEAGRNKRSVWTVATAPYPDAHFATYPPDLIKPCILAGTSAKGCCAKCGSPWERMVDVSYEKGYRTGHLGYNARGNAQGMTDMSKYPAMDKITKTIGWQPTCGCSLSEKGDVEDSFVSATQRTDYGRLAQTVPAIILDPFAGSGTTGAVALELGRSAILIELNPKYVELIEKRCTTTIGLALA